MRILIAGIGNVLFGDDAFGSEVARRLGSQVWPADVRIGDFGIRVLHLAYELLDAADLLIVIDAVPRGMAPGTLYEIEPALDAGAGRALGSVHALDIEGVFAALRLLGGEPPRVRIVGCEPASLEPGMGLSAAIEHALPGAIRLVQELVARELQHPEPEPVEAPR